MVIPKARNTMLYRRPELMNLIRAAATFTKRLAGMDPGKKRSPHQKKVRAVHTRRKAKTGTGKCTINGQRVYTMCKGHWERTHPKKLTSAYSREPYAKSTYSSGASNES